MKQSCFEFYKPSADDLTELWGKAIFAFDANVLLDLYRYSEETRKELLSFLKKHSATIWMPYQFAREFQTNRLDIVCEQKKNYEQMRELLRKQNDQFCKSFPRHGFLPVENLAAELKSAHEAIIKKIGDAEASHPDWIENDPVLLAVTELFEGKVGPALTNKEIGSVCSEGKRRYELKIPPGFKDVVKPDVTEEDAIQYGHAIGVGRYGDLVGWREMINKSKKEQKPLIFITGDEKEDWWHEHHGQKMGPRVELVREFATDTDGQKFHIYTIKQLLEHGGKEFAPEALTEISEIEQNSTKDALVASDVGAVPPTGILSSDVEVRSATEPPSVKGD